MSFLVVNKSPLWVNQWNFSILFLKMEKYEHAKYKSIYWGSIMWCNVKNYFTEGELKVLNIWESFIEKKLLVMINKGSGAEQVEFDYKVQYVIFKISFLCTYSNICLFTSVIITFLFTYLFTRWYTVLANEAVLLLCKVCYNWKILIKNNAEK